MPTENSFFHFILYFSFLCLKWRGRRKRREWGERRLSCQKATFPRMTYCPSVFNNCFVFTPPTFESLQSLETSRPFLDLTDDEGNARAFINLWLKLSLPKNSWLLLKLGSKDRWPTNQSINQLINHSINHTAIHQVTDGTDLLISDLIYISGPAPEYLSLIIYLLHTVYHHNIIDENNHQKCILILRNKIIFFDGKICSQNEIWESRNQREKSLPPLSPLVNANQNKIIK